MPVIVAGEALIDLAPRGEQLLPLPGGSPYNVAFGLGRLGTTTRYLGGLSTDAFGATLADRLTDAGVDLSLAPRYDAPTTLAVLHLDPEGRASYGFYLDGTAAAALDEPELPALPGSEALHVSLGAIGLGHAPTGHALSRLLTWEQGRRFRSLDPNVRPSVFEIAGGVAAYARLVDGLVTQLDLVKVSDEDLMALHPDADDALMVATDWAASGPALVVVTRGPHGAVAVRRDGRTVEVPGERVEVVDTVGAGDAFTAGLLGWLDAAALLDRDRLRAADDATITAALGYARRVAALTCTRAGADPPSPEQVGLPLGEVP